MAAHEMDEVTATYASGLAVVGGTWHGPAVAPVSFL